MKKTALLFILFIGTSLGSIAQNGLSFDGVNDRVDCGNDPSIQITGTAITLEAWIYPTSWRDNVWQGNIINKEIFVPQDGYMLRCGDGGRLNFNFGSGFGWNELNTDAPVLVLNEWQHVAATYDGATQRLYVNGVEVASVANSASIVDPGTNLIIGDNGDASRQFPGTIDEVKIWDVPRTAEEIIEDMETSYCPSALPVEGLQLYYPFNQGTAGGFNFGEITVIDFSGNGNDGETAGFAMLGDFSNWIEGAPDLISEGFETTALTISACESYTVPSGDETYTESGVYMDTIVYEVGCDELYTITLSFDAEPTETEITAASCESYTVPSGDETYIVSGVYNDTLTSIFGCDSILIIDVTINTGAESELEVSTCDPSYTAPSGAVYMASGEYVDVIETESGCDSTISISLTINTSTSSEIEAETCDSYTVPSGTATYSESGTYEDVITNEAGCDSVITINLTVSPINLTVTNSDPTLTSEATDVTYQWVDCNDGFEIIDGATEQSFTPEANGNYAVIISNGICSEQSECFNIQTVSIDEDELINASVYPNPTTGLLNITLPNPSLVEHARVLTVDGKLVQNISLTGESVIQLELEGASGLYFLELISNEGSQKIKLIKE